MKLQVEPGKSGRMATRKRRGERSQEISLAERSLPVAGVAVGAVHLLRAQELSHHSIMTCLAHRESHLVAVQPNDLAAPTAFDRRRELLSDDLFFRQSVFNQH